MPRSLLLAALVAFALAVFAPAVRAQACTTSWINPAGGAWSFAPNWDAGVPTAADHACITLDGTYTVTVGYFHVDQLTLGRFSGGQQTLAASAGFRLDTPSTIRLTGVLDWTAGYFTGGTTLTNRGLILLTGPTIERGIEDAGTVLRNEATVTHSGSGRFNDHYDALVENAGLWNFTANGGISGSGGVTGTFTNEATGTVRKSLGLGTTSIAGITFRNLGTLDVLNGKLQVSGTSIHTVATLQASAGATLRLIGSQTFVGDHDGDIEGTLELAADFAGVAGASWAFTGSGIEWQSGDLTAGTITNTGLVRLTGGSSTGVASVDAVFRNEGTVEQEDSVFNFEISDGARVENSDLWKLTGSAGLVGTDDGGTFVNEPGAILRKTGADTATMTGSLLLSNQGTVSVLGGTLELQNLSLHTDATFNVSAGATLRIESLVVVFNGTAGGDIGGTLALSATVSAPSATTWAFTGEGIEWESGTLSHGELTNTGLVRLTGASVSRGVSGAGAVFRNEGTVEHADAGYFNVSIGARVENDGVWELTGQGSIGTTETDGTFVNEATGTLRKRNAGTVLIFGHNFTVENAGTVDVQGGTLVINATFDHQDDARVEGSGTLDVDAVYADVTHDGNTAPGLTGEPGRLTWVGDYAPTPSATFFAQVTGTAAATEYDQLAVEGTATLGGTLRVFYPSGYVPSPGDQFRLLTCTVACSGTFDTVVLPPGAVGRLVYSDRAVDYFADPEPTYTVTAPAAGARWAYGEKYSIKWTGPGLPDDTQYARLFLVDGVHAPVEIALVKNKGSFKFKDLTDALPPGTTYRVRVELDGDPSVYGLSEPFTIYDPAETFVFTSPVAGETYARGTTQTVTWTSPAGAAGPVVLTFLRVATPVFSVTIPDTGTYSYTVPASGIVSLHYFTIRDADEPLYFGQSANVVIGRFQVTDPVQTDVWTAGETRTVAWAGPNLNSSGTLKVLLKRKGFANTTLATLVPYSAGSVSVTVPDVAPAADYYVTLVYSLGANAPLTVNSLEFTMTGGSPRVAASQLASHLASPVGVEDWTELSVAVPSLEDGTEVAAFAGDVLLGVGRVAGGAATVWVAGTYVDGAGDDVSVAPSAPLALRAFTAGDVDGAAVALVPSSVTSGTSGEAAALALSAGDVLFVAVETPVPAEAASTVALPSETALRAPSPNPAAGRVALRYDLAEAAAVRVTVYDALGRLVAVVADETREAGRYEASLDGSRLAPGVYVVRLAAGPFTATERLTVVR